MGRQVVARLVRAGKSVRAMTRRPQTGSLPDSVEVVRADFERPDTWPAALDGVRSVYLFPFVYAATDHGFVDEAVKAGVTRFVVHSAAAAGFAPGTGGDGALGRHLAEERKAHRAVERLVEASGTEWTHVRPGLLAANALQWADQIRTERVVRGPYAAAGYPLVHEADVADVAVRPGEFAANWLDGASTIKEHRMVRRPYGAAVTQPTHEADIAAVAATVLVEDGHAGRTHTFAGPEALTTVAQVDVIGTAIGATVRFDELDPAQARAEWLSNGYPETFVDWIFTMWAESSRNPASTNRKWADIVPRLTGRPARTFARWATEHASDFR